METMYADAQNVRNTFTGIKDEHFVKSVSLKLGIIKVYNAFQCIIYTVINFKKQP
jgi:uncharacterized protein YlbG (UPF0298 family)